MAGGSNFAVLMLLGLLQRIMCSGDGNSGAVTNCPSTGCLQERQDHEMHAFVQTNIQRLSAETGTDSIMDNASSAVVEEVTAANEGQHQKPAAQKKCGNLAVIACDDSNCSKGCMFDSFYSSEFMNGCAQYGKWYSHAHRCEGDGYCLIPFNSEDCSVRPLEPNCRKYGVCWPGPGHKGTDKGSHYYLPMKEESEIVPPPFIPAEKCPNCPTHEK
eukprot:TRINITY_DN976_c0_g2_i1.p1 TRINITY_DN976_c0_g2~~TRINITY_DN976_c0_g2_i1.p1  ORF type:complete len:233 (-),score=26.32 TRINITY_DN976_c0_g2_i1:155-799(-)